MFLKKQIEQFEMSFFGNTQLGYQNTIREYIKNPIDHSKTYLPKLSHDQLSKEVKPELSWLEYSEKKKYRSSTLASIP